MWCANACDGFTGGSALYSLYRCQGRAAGGPGPCHAGPACPCVEERDRSTIVDMGLCGVSVGFVYVRVKLNWIETILFESLRIGKLFRGSEPGRGGCANFISYAACDVRVCTMRFRGARVAALLLTAGSVHAFSCEASLRLPLLQKCRRSAALSLKIPEAPISDFMTPIADAVVLDPEMNLRIAATLMQEKQITGAPVVSNKKLVGVLSQFDFLFKAAGPTALNLEAESYQTTVKKILGGTVRNAMTLDPVTFSPRDSVRARPHTRPRCS